MQLYQRLLGASFERLPPPMRRFHAQPGGEAECLFHVRRAPGAFRAAIARFLALPAPADAARVVLRVRVSGERELWTRTFPDCELRSVQWLENGHLIEQHGLVRFAFDVEADETGMRLAGRGCRVLGVPLPRALAPALAATSRGDAKGWNVEVSIGLPLVGEVLSYGGAVVPA